MVETEQIKYFAEYIWYDCEGNFRSKTRVCKYTIESGVNKSILLNKEIYPHWNYDGSSTGQAQQNTSEVHLEPLVVYKDPFRGGNNVLVLCDIYTLEYYNNTHNRKYLTPHHNIIEYFQKHKNSQSTFGLEQEFFLIDRATQNPYSTVSSFNNIITNIKDKIMNSSSQNEYCGVGVINDKVRSYLELCLKHFEYMNLSITGMNLEVAPSQGEYQVCNVGELASFDLMILRYVLNRESENWPFYVSLEPKLKLNKNMNGSGCHINFSTLDMRSKGGYEVIQNVLSYMKTLPTDEHLKYYGSNNKERLTGKNETSRWDQFTIGEGHRGCSIRIPQQTIRDGHGYFEDRRPGGNIDPLVATHYLFTKYINYNNQRQTDI